MLMSMPSFTLPNPALVRTVRLRRPAAQLFRWDCYAIHVQMVERKATSEFYNDRRTPNHRCNWGAF